MNMLSIFSKTIANKNFALKGQFNKYSFSRFCTINNQSKTKSIYKKINNDKSSSMNQKNSYEPSPTKIIQNTQKESERFTNKQNFQEKETPKKKFKENSNDDLFTENLKIGMDEYLNKMVMKF
jgi:hypothetical protein